MKVRVVLADDHAVLRTGLAMFLNAQPDLEVVGEAEDGFSAVRQVLETQPDIVIVDLSMGPHSGHEAIANIRETSPKTKMLVLSMHAEVSYVRMAFAAGAMGYVTKSAADSDLLSAVRAVAQGRMFVDLAIGLPSEREEALGLSEGERQPQTFVPLGTISRRESEVLRRVAQGYTNQQVAEQLGLSVKSVETYRARLLEKLGVRTRAELVRYAVVSGLLTPEQLIPSD
ncbi:MAG: response regulator transcription factor [Nitrospira sp.]|nr:response regulator transcription factor [Nitrospira sp.]